MLMKTEHVATLSEIAAIEVESSCEISECDFAAFSGQCMILRAREASYLHKYSYTPYERGRVIVLGREYLQDTPMIIESVADLFESAVYLDICQRVLQQELRLTHCPVFLLPRNLQAIDRGLQIVDAVIHRCANHLGCFFFPCTMRQTELLPPRGLRVVVKLVDDPL